jgi:uncharacterized protein YdhG (YjbR/CyaY superfamily)
MPDTKTAKRTGGRNTSSVGWTDEERAAMKEHAAELKKAKSRGGKTKKADGEADVLEKIAEMPDSDRAMAERIHSIIKDVAPDLVPRTWYGMPAYANEEGNVICFFTAADKFKERYASFGFNAAANLDEGTMWPTAWALTQVDAAGERKIAELVKRAVSQARPS